MEARKVKRIIGLFLCILLIETANNAFPLSWRSGKLTFWSYDRNLEWAPGEPVFTRSLYIMNADGSNVTKLVESEIQEGGSRFVLNGPFSLSPDCREVAFWMGDLNSKQCDIAILDIQSRTISNLTNGRSESCAGPRWSLDGKEIVFYSVNGIVLMNRDGTNMRNLDEGIWPEWSHDGRRIAFVRDRQDIYTMDADGDNLRNIAKFPADVGSVGTLRWSPDSRRILFRVSVLGGGSRIYVMDLDRDDWKLIREARQMGHGCWSPDGKKIAFNAIIDPDDDAHIWVMDADGSDLERLTNNDREEFEIDWRDPAFSGISPSPNSAETTWGEIKTRE